VNFKIGKVSSNRPSARKMPATRKSRLIITSSSSVLVVLLVDENRDVVEVIGTVVVDRFLELPIDTVVIVFGSGSAIILVVVVVVKADAPHNTNAKTQSTLIVVIGLLPTTLGGGYCPHCIKQYNVQRIDVIDRWGHYV
jgi:hypothetical protein